MTPSPVSSGDLCPRCKQPVERLPRFVDAACRIKEWVSYDPGMGERHRCPDMMAPAPLTEAAYYAALGKKPPRPTARPYQRPVEGQPRKKEPPKPARTMEIPS